jgi:hypothetical protein
MDINIKELASIIDDGDFSRLIGLAENDFFDCKRDAYDLKNNKAKYELSKDVSAFTNAGGGYILIGIETKKSEYSFYDEIIALHPFSEGICNPKQYIDIISDWIYPKVKDVAAKWYPMKEGLGKGIFVIEVPNQSKILKPFLIKRSIQESGKTSEVLFGYSERKLETNEPKTVIELHQILRDGLYYNDYLDKRFQSIETALQEISEPSPAINDEFYEIDKRIDAALSAVEMKDKRAMILACYPDIPTKLETIFSSKPDGLKSILESPPKIRERGFGLRVLNKAKIIKGMLCRVTGGSRKVIDLYKDGVLVAALKADEDFLCWAMKDLIINPVALIESIYNFVQLYEYVIKDMTKKPNKIFFRIELRNLILDNVKTKLAIGSLENTKALFADEVQPAPADNWNDILEVELNDFDLAKVAYNITEMIYLFFGLDVDDIPYTKEIDGIKAIDIKPIELL